MFDREKHNKENISGDDKVITEKSRGKRKCVSPLQTRLFLSTPYDISMVIDADDDDDSG